MSSQKRPWSPKFKTEAVDDKIVRKILLKPTDEQVAVIRSNAPVIVANAYAGGGKTSMLQMYTERRHEESFLYVAYSKALQLEAERKFGDNTVCRTTHAVAFPKFGSKVSHKLGNLRALDISRQFNVRFNQAKEVVETLMNYLASADRELSHKHLAGDLAQRMDSERYVQLAKDVWKAAQDPDDEMPMPHDGYLKQFALSDPDLSSRFRTILFDEAQDANPVTTQIILSQRNCRIVMVGDRYQSIFGFRGASNAIEMVELMGTPSGVSPEVHYLTKSFRFGNGIAGLATMLLKDFLGAERPVIGLGEHRTTSFKIDPAQQYAVLTRTNGGIFRNAVEMVESHTPFCLVNGIDNYNFGQVHDMYRLYMNRNDEIRDSFIKRFESFSEVRDYADQTEDLSMRSLVKIVDEYKHDIPKLIKLIKERVLDDEPAFRAQARVVMTTAHKAKGLEFDQVFLDDDFQPLMDSETDEPMAVETRADREEVHLLYVAATRARRALKVNNAIGDYVRYKQSPETYQAARDKRDRSSQRSAAHGR